MAALDVLDILARGGLEAQGAVLLELERHISYLCKLHLGLR